MKSDAKFLTLIRSCVKHVHIFRTLAEKLNFSIFDYGNLFFTV